MHLHVLSIVVWGNDDLETHLRSLLTSAYLENFEESRKCDLCMRMRRISFELFGVVREPSINHCNLKEIFLSLNPIEINFIE